MVIVDGTQTYSGDWSLNDSYLECSYNKGTEKESVDYHCDVLEAKIVTMKNWWWVQRVNL